MTLPPAAPPPLPIELLQAMLAELPMRVALLDEALRYRFVNPAMLRRLGRAPEDVLGQTVTAIRGQAASQRLLAALPELRAGRTVHWEGESHFEGQSDQVTEVWLQPFAQADGQLHVLLYAHDITALKAQQQQLQHQLDTIRSVEHLKAVIVDNALAAFVSTDAEGRVVEFNPAAEAMFHCSRADALGQPVEAIMIPPDQRAAHRAGLQRMRAGHAPRILGKRMELVAQRRDGSQFPVEMVLWQTDLDGRPHFTASLIDLSERQRAAEIIERQREALRRSERIGAMGTMLAGVAHELNNPLAIVMGRSTLLEEKTAGSELADDVRRIREAAERCGRIVRTFLDLARARPTVRQPVALNDLVRGAIDLMRYGLRSHSIDVQLDLAAELPEPLGNADQLGQIVLNLVVNAQQALASQAQRRVIQIASGTDRDASGAIARVWLRVGDNGSGVPAHRRDSIFEPYFSSHPSGEGLGLGLAMCRSFARRHGGELLLEPAAHGGASFRLELPVSNAAASPPAGPPAPQADPVEGQRILVADDEPEITELMRRFLEDAGYEVVIAESGQIALALLGEARFDAVVSDLRMPDLDGAGLWRALQAHWPQLTQRLLFVTGDTLSAGAATFFAETGCPTLLKPFTRAELQAAVRELLARSVTG